jgi:hypothetical protein
MNVKEKINIERLFAGGSSGLADLQFKFALLECLEGIKEELADLNQGFHDWQESELRERFYN